MESASPARSLTVPKYEEPPAICEKGASGGFFFPLFGDDEADWPDVLKGVLYGLGLAWCFLGVSLLADMFMGAIEVITSKKRRLFDKRTKRYRTVKIWNDTVANLTLMALGSSAPEILLNVLELFNEDFHSGALGPGTIVGSAAFNLFVIAAVCVIAIPSPEVRYIKDTTVYAVTVLFSLFAYMWVLFILVGTSKDVVDIWEALLTLAFFPALILLAYLADRGYLGGPPTTQRRVFASELTKEELAEIIRGVQMSHTGKPLLPDQVEALVERQTTSAPSRAAYRLGRYPSMKSQQPMLSPKLSFFQPKELPMTTSQTLSRDPTKAIVEFVTQHYMVGEGNGKVVTRVQRRGNLDREFSVRYRTLEGTAEADKDYVHTEGVVMFKAGDEAKEITIEILDDEDVEDIEAFSLELYDLKVKDGQPPAGVEIGGKQKTMIKIIDDDDAGKLQFEKELVEVEEKTAEDIELNVQVQRVTGSCGRITCRCFTESDSAVSPLDFEPIDTEVVLAAGETTFDVQLTIHPRGRYGNSSQFRLMLKDPTGGASFVASTDGGSEECVCTVLIKANPEYMSTVDTVAKNLAINWGRAKLGQTNWKDQFASLIYVGGSAESHSEAGPLDWFFFIISFPWKAVFAFIPPTEFCNGWLCFISALAGIAFVTAAISDLANLVGCVISLKPQITAITIVALGTSLPDTFASKTAAEQDEYADASIGNITGSNSVNVFLGLGLPWSIGALYWKIKGKTTEWRQRYDCPDIAGWSCEFPDGGFIVKAGSLGFSVAVYTACALACLFCLFVRRRLFGGELGGPAAPKWATAVFLLLLWALYVAASWIYAEFDEE